MFIFRNPVIFFSIAVALCFGLAVVGAVWSLMLEYLLCLPVFAFNIGGGVLCGRMRAKRNLNESGENSNWLIDHKQLPDNKTRQ